MPEPAPTPLIAIADDTPPLGETPLADIPEEVVPLDNLPQTGMADTAPYMIICLFASCMAALTGWLSFKRRREEQNGI
jgi:LPXTG-motif cell wall-anchored protein